MGYRIGVDVGGTFTDLVALDEDGQLVLEKTPTTPGDQSDGVMAGLEQLAPQSASARHTSSSLVPTRSCTARPRATTR